VFYRVNTVQVPWSVVGFNKWQFIQSWK
jgi:hypothetical protein